MSWDRIIRAGAPGAAAVAASLAASALLVPKVSMALTQVSGPVTIGPSSGEGDPGAHRATLSTTVTNRGALPDRLINVACPGVGEAHLLNGQVQPVGDTQRNGLDTPGVTDGRATPVPVQIGLGNASVPMGAGALIPCSLYFQHAGQRIVVFMLGAKASNTIEP